MGAGRAVIATSVGHNTALADTVTLTKPGDVEELTRALGRLLNSAEQLDAAAAKVRQEALLRSWDALAKRYAGAYATLLTNGAKS
jgi:glycosyltransferase involved in cell wall biosynthesis